MSWSNLKTRTTLNRANKTEQTDWNGHLKHGSNAIINGNSTDHTETAPRNQLKAIINDQSRISNEAVRVNRWLL